MYISSKAMLYLIHSRYRNISFRLVHPTPQYSVLHLIQGRLHLTTLGNISSKLLIHRRLHLIKASQLLIPQLWNVSSTGTAHPGKITSHPQICYISERPGYISSTTLPFSTRTMFHLSSTVGYISSMLTLFYTRCLGMVFSHVIWTIQVHLTFRTGHGRFAIH